MLKGLGNWICYGIRWECKGCGWAIGFLHKWFLSSVWAVVVKSVNWGWKGTIWGVLSGFRSLWFNNNLKDPYFWYRQMSCSCDATWEEIIAIKRATLSFIPWPLCPEIISWCELSFTPLASVILKYNCGALHYFDRITNQKSNCFVCPPSSITMTLLEDMEALSNPYYFQ